MDKMKKESIKVFAPATVANVGCGYDIFGLALEGIGDELTIIKSAKKGIRITKIEGCDHLPLDPALNVAGVAIQALLDTTDNDQGFEVAITKKVLPGSGLGSSASSAAGAVFAANQLLGAPLSTKELIPCAMEGEKAASTKAHADNVAPSLLGGFTLVRSYQPLDIVSIPFPTALYVAIVHPQIEVKTADSKRILKTEIPLQKAITQWGNTAGLAVGLATEDFDLIGRSLKDVIVEPIRSMLIPGYEKAKEMALAAGALGCNISGSGPSIFALCHGKPKAAAVVAAFEKLYTALNIDHKVYLSKINPTGTKII